MIAVHDAITGKCWVAPSGIHLPLILAAEVELGIAHLSGNDRFVSCYIMEDGEFVTGITKAPRSDHAKS